MKHEAVDTKVGALKLIGLDEKYSVSVIQFETAPEAIGAVLRWDDKTVAGFKAATAGYDLNTIRDVLNSDNEQNAKQGPKQAIRNVATDEKLSKPEKVEKAKKLIADHKKRAKLFIMKGPRTKGFGKTMAGKVSSAALEKLGEDKYKAAMRKVYTDNNMEIPDELK